MSLAYVILGLLQQQERTGYALKTECFDQCISHLWQADQAQIYRTLDKLEAQGWLTCTVEIQHDRPNRKVHHISEAGEAALNQWLQTHQPLPILREPLLVQLHFATQMADETIIQLLEQAVEARRKKLAACAALDVLPLEYAAVSREQTMHRLILELVTRREQLYLDWLKDTISIIHSQSTD
jgi:PadR family transcriptional regulator, regulatory protein AphA